MTAADALPLLRARGGHTPVTNEELFFDLIYAFAVTQLTHQLLQNLTGWGGAQTLVLWFAVWLGWQYTAWVTNWFDPRHPRLRLLLFAGMLAGLLMACAIPQAFGAHAWLFALSYAGLQVGRSVFAVLHLSGQRVLRSNFARILGWLSISALLWIAGAAAQGAARMGWWVAAVGCEYVSPMIGFALPGLGRSATTDWTVDGAHLAERCQLFVIVALGESILDSGSGFSAAPRWDAPTLIALGVAFAGSLALWWIYFDTSVRHGSREMALARDPGRIAARFFYVHVTLIAGIIVAAAADDLLIREPHRPVDAAGAALLVGGPVIYLAGNAAYKRILYGWVPPSHLGGLALLAALFAAGRFTDRLMAGALAGAILVGVAAWQSRHAPPLPDAAAPR